MLPQQTCPGKVNHGLQCTALLLWKGDRYIVYATGANAVIYTSRFDHVQTIQTVKLLKDCGKLESDTILGSVTGVAFDTATGKLVVSYAQFALIFGVNGSEGLTTWVLDKIVSEQNKDELIYCVHWNSRGELLTAGEQLSVWECNDQQDWKKIWTQRQENNRNHT
ncbi:regulator of (H+)-ATPase in vacuolar membrane [Umbelopsis sp. WA50703]